ncbi:MAG: DUF4270 domain-containing protein [Chitinophagaceae bacterium]|nr:DUF4270 domain-containing protein [Chitinophagaceae bacterium]MCW5905047.1 DUF4270 domain-containing protein [Chitinophagaceae bacterium]
MKKFLFPAFIICFAIVSCTKISVTEIGSELIPPIDGVHTFDTTIDVETYNILLDSFRISKSQEMVLGTISNDPLMGGTKAIVNTEFKPPIFPFYFPVGKDSLTLDSAVLVLSYTGLYGDSTNPMHLKVYEISQSSKFNVDSIYPASASMNLAGQIGELHITDPRKLSDSVKAFSENSINQIRIPLTTSFGNKLLKQFDSSNAYYSSLQFSSIFRGFSIVPQGTSNTLLKVSLTDTNSKVALYYKYKQRNGVDTTVVTFFRTVAGMTGASNNITRNRAGSQSEQYLNNAVTTQDDLLFLQAGQGNYVRIKTPGIAGISNRIIHRAELIMEQEADNDAFYNTFTAPNLFLCAISTHPDSAAYRFYIPKDIVLGQGGIVDNLGLFGGNIIYKNDANGKRIASYNFNISRYVQSIITFQQKVYDLYLFAPVTDYVYAGEGMTNGVYPIASSALNTPAAGRVRLLGGNNPQQNRKMRIRIIYSTL